MERKQNKSLAILMLCVVILVGAVLWGLLYTFGWLASLMAFATAYVGIVVYGKFYPVSKKVYIISGVAIVVANVIASFLALVIAIAVKADCDFVTALNALISVMGDYAFDLGKDFVVCIVLIILGLVGVKKLYEDKKCKKQEQNNSVEAETKPEEAKNVQETETQADQLAAENPVEKMDEPAEKATDTEEN